MAAELNSLERIDMSTEKESLIRKVEVGAENCLFATRWLLAPVFYLFPIVMGIMVFEFIGQLWALLLTFVHSDMENIVQRVLNLIETSLVCGLVLIVMISGYENFVSKLDIAEHPDYPHWMRNITFGKMKILLLATTVPMSVIHLVVDMYKIDEISNRNLIATIVLHFVFVITAIGMAYMDKILHGSDNNHKEI